MSGTPTPPPARRGRGRPRGTETGATRERIVAAAADLFADRGFHATPMTAVAEAAGLSQTGLAHHFPSKEQLLADVLQQRDVQDMEAITGISDGPRRGWGVLDGCAALVRRNAGREGLVRLFTSLSGEAIDPSHPGHPWLRAHHEDARAGIRDALLQAQQEGTARPDTPVDQIAQNTVALMDGLQLQWLLERGRVDMAADFEEYVQSVRNRWELPAN